MLFRNCSGGVVFCRNCVFLLKNEKSEWVLPKGVIRSGMLASEVAISRVKQEAGIDAEIVSTAGATSYEFYSISRQKPVCNEITWYIMRANSDKFIINKEEGFQDGGFYPIDEALKLITYSQDRSLVKVSYDKFRHINLR